MTLSKALFLDVVHLPSLGDGGDGPNAVDNKQIIDYEEALKRMKEHLKDTGGAFIEGNVQIADFVKSTLGRVNESDEEDDGEPPEEEVKELIAQERSRRQRDKWSKKELIETLKKRNLRREVQTSLLGTVVLLAVIQLFSAGVLVF